jgi:hypothetical protein
MASHAPTVGHALHSRRELRILATIHHVIVATVRLSAASERARTVTGVRMAAGMPQAVTGHEGTVAHLVLLALAHVSRPLSQPAPAGAIAI